MTGARTISDAKERLGEFSLAENPGGYNSTPTHLMGSRFQPLCPVISPGVPLKLPLHLQACRHEPMHASGGKYA